MSYCKTSDQQTTIWLIDCCVLRITATGSHVQSSSCCLLTNPRRATTHIKQLQHLHDWHVHEAYRNHAVCIRLQKTYTEFSFCPADDIAWVSLRLFYTVTFLQLTCLYNDCYWPKNVGHYSCSPALLDEPATVHYGKSTLYLLRKWHAMPYTRPISLRLQIARVNIC